MMNSIVAGRSVIPAWMSKNVDNGLVIKVETNYPCGVNNRDYGTTRLVNTRRNHYNYIYLAAKKQLRTLLILNSE